MIDRNGSVAQANSGAVHGAPKGRRVGGCVARLGLLGLGGLAAALIVLLVLAFVWTQFGPGGALSRVRPGRPAPDFDVPMLGGGRISLAELEGRPVALNFWATWCPPCVIELPLLQEAERRHADVGLAVVALNAGQHHEYLEGFMAERGLDIPIALDPGKDVYERYRVVGLPTTVWIDADGVVRAIELGVLTNDKIDAYVAQLTAGP